MKKKLLSLGLTMVLALLVGCGAGSTSSNSIASDSSQPFAFGDLSGRAVLSAAPQTVETSQTTVTSLVGQITDMSMTGGASPVLSSTRIAFHRGEGGIYEIFTCRPDGTDVRQLTNTGYNILPSYSFDGRKIVFVSRRDGENAQIYVMNVNGLGVVRITNDTYSNMEPMFSPDGTKIVFMRSSGIGDRYKIWTMNANGSNPVQLTSGAGSDQNPSWSPDGAKIAFHSNRDAQSHPNIYTMNADGSSIQRITFGTDFDGNPNWSPVGRRIAFASGGQITIVNADGSNPISISDPTKTDLTPYWSPDGTRIVFMRQSDKGIPSVYTMAADGSDVVPVAEASPLYSVDPAWSPFSRLRSLIGAKGVLGKLASGVLFSRADNAINSILSYSAVTPSSVKVTPASLTPSGPNIVFTVEADTLNQLSFVNAPDFIATNVVGNGGSVGADGALIDISSANGKVNTVLPFGKARSVHTRPTVTQAEGRHRFSGNFLAVYTSNGKNLAPKGASEVVVDATTGRVVSVR